jgi:hypothetical protein
MTSSASIDDLLRYEEEPPRTERGRESLAGWMAKSALTAAVLTALIAVVMRVYGVAPPYLLVFSGLLALLGLRRVLAGVAQPPPPRTRHYRVSAGTEDGLYAWGVQDALRDASRRWENRFEWAKGDPATFVRTTQPVLREVFDERLRLRYGASARNDPARAQAILGEVLWSFLTTAPTRMPKPHELDLLLDELERLDNRERPSAGGER